MLQVILVDDEESNLALMQKVIEWRDYGFEIAGTALDGKEGLELYERTLPDLAIIDIRMPVMSGIDMIRKIKEKRPDARIIILSAYGEFEYAQQAIEFGIDAYLLKPINERKLIGMLETIQKSATRKRKDHLAQRLRHYLTVDQPDDRGNEELKKLAQDHGIVGYIAVHARFDAEQPEQEAFAAAVHSDFLLLSKGERESLLLFYSRTDRSQIEWPRISDRLRVQRESLRLGGGHSFVCGVSQPFLSLAEIRAAVLQSEYALSLHFYEEKDGIILYHPTYEHAALIGHDLGKLEWQLGEELQAGKFPKAIEHLEQAFEHYREHRLMASDLHRLCMRILHLFQQIFGRMDCRSGEQWLAPFTEAYIRQFDSFAALKKFMLQATMQAGGIINELLHSNRNFAVVRKAKQFALLHYHEEDLSIQQVSEHVGLSRNHFSRLFKEQTGDNFWDYVIRLRMEEAKRQLRQTNHTNYEIARSIGYNSEYHFSRIFAKVEGMTTSQYRKVHAN